MRIILLRHGQSEGNKQHILQGTLEYDLSDLGRAQMEAAADWLADEYIDVIYSSTQQRARQSAEILKAKHYVHDIIADPKLNEIHYGDLEGKSLPDLENHEQDTLEQIRNLERIDHHNGEHFGHIKDRTGRFWDRIRDTHKENTVAIVAHHSPVKALLHHIADISEEELAGLHIPNTAISVIEHTGDHFHIHTLGSTEHLDE